MPRGRHLLIQDWSEQMARLRPRLHRYCARMMGSAFDGEDVVQDALIKATAALAAADVDNVEAWVLRIAHNTALDALRQRRRAGRVAEEEALDEWPDERATADRELAAAASLSLFQQLPVLQRSCLLLADVLGYSIAEIANLVGSSVAAVKSALHRGRDRLRIISQTPTAELSPLSNSDEVRLRAYAERFNARDFDALRDLLSEEAQLDLVNRLQLSGRGPVSTYFSRYGEKANWHVQVGWAEERPVLLVSETDAASYVVLIEWHDARIARIRDFRFARYVMDALTVRPPVS
jgi:RNA polymerase sigma-70 factor, ECF subfamily